MAPVALEDEIRALVEAGDLGGAATRVIRGYGPEVLGFLIGLLGDADRARDALAQASEDLWAGLPGFRGRASARTWFYTIARNAAARLRRSPAHQARRHVALSEVSEIAAAVRTTTAAYLPPRSRTASPRSARRCRPTIGRSSSCASTAR